MLRVCRWKIDRFGTGRGGRFTVFSFPFYTPTVIFFVPCSTGVLFLPSLL